jgi:transcriptional regulator with XRE-family HTH domain
MKAPNVDTQWFKARLKEIGKTQAQLATEIRKSEPAVSLMLRGKQNVRVQEAQQVATALDSPLNDVLRAFGIVNPDGTPRMLPVVGYVGAGDQVILLDEQDAEYALDEIPSPFPGYMGCVVRIRGTSMSPRYFDGELIGFTPDGNDINRLVGGEVVAKLADGRLGLKILQRGTARGSYTLVSMDRAIPPIVDASIEWAAEIDWHKPQLPR